VPRALVEEIVAHCLQGRPNEACGILASRAGGVTKVFRMRNASASPLRYSLDPKEQLAVYNAIDSKGWELGGVFHSHTRTAAYPSPTDVRLAAEDVPYMIVSLAADPPSLLAFRIVRESWTDARGKILEVPVEVVDDGQAEPEEGRDPSR
jgi:[CysO sulfur-carrier protein]-S-L-cysteine hydrolase